MALRRRHRAAARGGPPVVGAVFTTDPHVRDLLVPVLLVAAVAQPLAGIVFVLDGVLIGAGDAVYLAWAQLASLAVFAPAAYVLQVGRRSAGAGLALGRLRLPVHGRPRADPADPRPRRPLDAARRLRAGPAVTTLASCRSRGRAARRWAPPGILAGLHVRLAVAADRDGPGDRVPHRGLPRAPVAVVAAVRRPAGPGRLGARARRDDRADPGRAGLRPDALARRGRRGGQRAGVGPPAARTGSTRRASGSPRCPRSSSASGSPARSACRAPGRSRRRVRGQTVRPAGVGRRAGRRTARAHLRRRHRRSWSPRPCWSPRSSTWRSSTTCSGCTAATWLGGPGPPRDPPDAA